MRSAILAIIFFCAFVLSQQQDSKLPKSAISHEQNSENKSCNDDNCTFVGRQEIQSREEPMKDHEEEGYGIIDGSDVPKNNSMVNSTFKATYYLLKNNEVRHCTVNFAEKTHILVTAAHCCQQIRSGPYLTLSNGYRRKFTVNVYASFLHSTYLFKDRMSDVCVIVLNYAVSGVTPLNLAYTKGKINDTITVYGYGWYVRKYPDDHERWPKTAKYLKTGTVTMVSDLNPSAINVSALSAQICPGDSGGGCFNSNKEFFGIVQGGKPKTCSKTEQGVITEFESLQNWMQNIISRFQEPPNQPGITL